MTLPVKIAGYFGVLGYWSVGKRQSPKLKLNESFHYSITPSLHYSSRLPLEKKTVEIPAGVG